MTKESKVIAPKKTTGMIKAPKGIKYYDLVKNWAKVKPHLGDPGLNKVLVKDLNKFTYGRRREKFTPGNVPFEHDKGCDWDIDLDADDWVLDEVTGESYQTGEAPEFWEYVCFGACHWLVNFNLRLAQLVEPKKQWRILTSRHHSTVWDGDRLQFNHQAFGVPPAGCFVEARQGGRELKVGKRRPTVLAEHWRVAARRRDREQRRRSRSVGLARRGPTKARGVFKSRTQTKQKQSMR
jgi:hypothetical protein